MSVTEETAKGIFQFYLLISFPPSLPSSLSLLGYPGIHYVDQTGLQLTENSPAWVLKLRDVLLPCLVQVLI